MRTEKITQNQKSPSFRAIKVPTSLYCDKINYKVMMDVIKKQAHTDTIKINRGITENNEIVDYILTDFNSKKENKIFKALSIFSEKIITALNKDANIDIEKFDKVQKNIDRDEVNIIGFDGSTSGTREKIRDYIESVSDPDKYKYKKFMQEINKQTKIDNSKIKLIRDKYTLKRVEQITDNAYRGQTLSEKTNALAPLKKAGIETIIDFEGYSTYRKSCEEAGLNYKSFVIQDDFWSQDAFTSEAEYLKGKKRYFDADEDFGEKEKFYKKMFENNSNAFVNKLKDLFKIINKGGFYAGCEYGTQRTDDALMLSKYFNPQDQQYDEVYVSDNKATHMLRLLNNLTTDDKEAMKWPSGFEENLHKKLVEEGAREYREVSDEELLKALEEYIARENTPKP